jgi:hypothetical protein
MLVYFEGGPLNGQVYDTGVLLGRVKRKPEIEFYEWTAGIKEGSSGKVASVWRYNDARAAGRKVE